MEKNVSLQRLIDHGAEVVAGTAYLNHKPMGQFHNGQFLFNDEGSNLLAELLAQDALAQAESAMPATPADPNPPHPANRAAKARTPKAAEQMPPVATPVAAAPQEPAAAPAPFVPPPAPPLPKALQAEADAAAGLMADLAALGVDPNQQ